MKRAKAMSRKAQQGAATLERIIAASMDLFAHRGIHPTSIDQIARRARVTKGAVYWHFRSKDHLVDAILQRIKEDWQRVVLHRLAAAVDPSDKVERLFDSYHALLSEEREICLILQRAMLEPDAALTRKVNDVFDRTARVIADVFEEGKQAGLFARELDSRVLALSVLSAFAGAVTHCYGDKTLPFAELISEIKQQTLARLDPSSHTAAGGQARSYVKRWAETGRLLEDLRWRELAQLDDKQALAATDALIDAALRVPLPPSRHSSSGLAAQQAAFHRLAPA
jgi:AcrR family transcriptional regulator